MTTRVTLKRPPRRCASESNSSNGKIMQSVDSNVESDASYGSIHAHAPPPRPNPSIAPQSSQILGHHSTSLQTPAPIDVEAIDDDVELLSSSRGFPQVRHQPKRTRPITVILDEEGEFQAGPSGTSRGSSNRSTINGQSRQRVQSKASGDSEVREDPAKKRRVTQSSELPPKEPSFSCSICWGKLEEETSTVCGHIFCQGCIKAAIQTQKKCPTCRRPLTLRNIHRIYLPLAK